MDGAFVFFIAVILGMFDPSRSFEGSIFILGDAVLGDTTRVQCSWNTAAGEIIERLQIRPDAFIPGDSNFFYNIIRLESSYRGNQADDRMALETINSTSRSVNMKITNLQCSDEKGYACFFEYGVQNDLQITKDAKNLTLKARPKSPSIRVTPSTGTDVLERTNITVVCNANLGRPGKGSLVWKIYRGSSGEDINTGDSRIVDTKPVTLQAEDGNCTQRIEQTFRMQVSRSDQDLTIACFVKNEDFQPNVPETCQNSTADLCVKTKPFRIVYGVTASSMTVTNPGILYQGMDVTLTCQAEGLPAPDYTWLRILEGDNNTESTEVAGTSNQLPLNNLQGGQELRYNCTANNTVLGTVYTATKGIQFSVLLTTTALPTTTTTRTKTTTTASTGTSANTGNQPQAGNKDDDGNTTTIIIVVVVVGSFLIIAIIIGVFCWRRQRARKQIEEPSEKPYNNRTNLSFQSSQPDLVADNKKLHTSSLDNSFNEKKEDGLMYADLTYDNKPRSRKPLAIDESSSDYSSIQMPQV